MNAPKLRDQIVDEIGRIPDARLLEVFDLLHFFRIGIESTKVVNGGGIMQFAGAWQDLSAEALDELQHDIAARRKAAFEQRKRHDGSAD